MEILMSFIVGILFMAATYLFAFQKPFEGDYRNCRSQPWRPSAFADDGRVKKRSAPILNEESTTYVDPLPQALILTAIVIAFGVTSFLLVMAFRAYQELKMDDMDQMRGNDQHE